MLIGTNTCHFNMRCFYTFRQQLQAIGLPQVDVPLCIPSGYPRHIKSGDFKSFIHLLAYLKRFKRNSRSDTGPHIFSFRAIQFAHPVEGLFHNPGYRPPPSGMNSRHHLVLPIITKHRDTIGGRDTKAHSHLVTDQSIHSLQQFSSFSGGNPINSSSITLTVVPCV